MTMNPNLAADLTAPPQEPAATTSACTCLNIFDRCPTCRGAGASPAGRQAARPRRPTPPRPTPEPAPKPAAEAPASRPSGSC